MKADLNAKTATKKLEHITEAEVCARMMANSEPWLTLRRDYDASLKMLTDPSREVYLAIVNSQMVGFIVLMMEGAFVGYIQSVCIAPEWRGRGIGSQLMSFIERRIFSEIPNVFICVSSFNKGALRVNPEQAPVFRPESRRIDSSNGVIFVYYRILLRD